MRPRSNMANAFPASASSENRRKASSNPAPSHRCHRGIDELLYRDHSTLHGKLHHCHLEVHCPPVHLPHLFFLILLFVHLPLCYPSRLPLYRSIYQSLLQMILPTKMVTPDLHCLGNHHIFNPFQFFLLGEWCQRYWLIGIGLPDFLPGGSP